MQKISDNFLQKTLDMVAYIIAGIISLIVTIVVVVKICQTANNTAAILDIMKRQFEKQDEAPAAMPNVSATNEDGTEKTVFQMRQEQQKEMEEKEKQLQHVHRNTHF